MNALTNLLELFPREPKLNPRQIRAKGFIPVTVYGKNVSESLSLQIVLADYKALGISRSVKTIDAIVKGQNTELLLLVKSIEKHPLSACVLNIQFQAVSNHTKVLLMVPIVCEGTSPLVQSGGTLSINNKRVKLSCEAKDIPSSVKFDLGRLREHSNIATYADLILPENVNLKSDSKQIIAKVSVPQVATK